MPSYLPSLLDQSMDRSNTWIVLITGSGTKKERRHHWRILSSSLITGISTYYKTRIWRQVYWLVTISLRHSKRKTRRLSMLVVVSHRSTSIFCSRFMWMVIYRSFNWPKRDQSYLDSDTDAGASSVLWLESRRAYQIGSLHLPPLFDHLLKVRFPIQLANP